jgi:hypothetical protein
VSADNGIGTAGRLHAVDSEPTGQRASWPKGPVPFPRTKNAPETGRSGWNWREILSTMGEIAGISAISAGAAWYSPGIGLIAGGVGLVALSFVAGIPRLPYREPEKR